MNVVKRVFNGSRAGQQIAANIYKRGNTGGSVSHNTGTKRLTLLLAHANGFHKELWEPTLQRLFEYEGKGWIIDQAVAFDGYNHGDSALLNRESIEGEEISPWYLNARDIVSIVGQLDRNPNSDVVGIGHSWGASSLLLAEIMSPLTFGALIITDPVLFAEPDNNSKIRELTMRRRSEWPDIDAAKKYFEPHPFFGAWDKRILDLHIRYGLETVQDPVSGKKKLVLKCRPTNEGAVYAGSYHASPHAAHGLWKVQCPTAFLTGEQSHLAGADHIKGLIKPMPDVQHVVMKDTGHLLVLEKPDQTADHYATLLDALAPKLVATNTIQRPSTPSSASL
ncbi:hypothetical protein LPJ59_002391 [Coemansia sp. RSA 2399]|nr:hypothetical protein LPJ59_002391 [Coemansia sp. RSA 2399]KAJ1896889.1 hypothetical protein LPJ81_004645 [Coemansia sp. IMI 209127]